MPKNIAVVYALCVAAACAVPSAAVAQSPAPAGGGASVPAASTSTTSDGTLAATPAALLGRTLRFRGALAGLRTGSAVAIERLTRRGTWERTAIAVTGTNGTFLARWRADHTGTFRVRAVPAGRQMSAQAASAPPTASVTVYRGAKATWYGPGFYGRETACGMTMTRDLLGVAHRGLPCGTPVALYYRGKSIVVPVVDRGPYANGASWDLTAATARALGFTFTDRIGALSLRGRAPLAPPPPPVPADRSGGASAPRQR